ncbi:MAG TPA: sigma-70 region 4 domain-containing protein [Candidatus Agathobaculum stercoravium]|mgnify:FL=1|nr:sigma-70 region 4 domain-containing protein [Candidatus Agathobaculum stercoravium]
MALIELYAALYQEYKRILTDRQYEVLWLHEIEGLSGKEISGRLDISQSAVSRHLTRGKISILKEIKRERAKQEDNA